MIESAKYMKNDTMKVEWDLSLRILTMMNVWIEKVILFESDFIESIELIVISYANHHCHLYDICDNKTYI